MEITRTSLVSGVTRTLDLPISIEQWRSYQSGTLIQEALPHLSPDEREFLMTGIYGGEWDEFVGDELE